MDIIKATRVLLDAADNWCDYLDENDRSSEIAPIEEAQGILFRLLPRTSTSLAEALGRPDMRTAADFLDALPPVGDLDPNRRVHASDHTHEVVRYERQGKWWIENRNGLTRRQVTIGEAVEYAVNCVSIHYNLPGGSTFDRKVRNELEV